MEKPKSQNLDKPHNYTELEKKRWTVEEVNSFREQQGLLEGKILVGYPSYEFKEWIMSGVNGVYHFIESDRYIQKFVDNFLQQSFPNMLLRIEFGIIGREVKKF